MKRKQCEDREDNKEYIFRYCIPRHSFFIDIYHIIEL